MAELAALSAEERAAQRSRAGLCADCAHLRLLSNGRSTFVLCGLSRQDPRFTRYPVLPVRGCRGFAAVAT